MPRNVVIAIIITCLFAPVLIFTSAVAATDLENYRKTVVVASEALAGSIAELKAMPRQEWTEARIQAYLRQATWAIYDGLLYHTQKLGSLPGDVASLAGTEYAPEWPGNPFADWAPMEVLLPEDGFKPGCLVMQVCPPEFYSDLRQPRPLSFELGIYGPDMKSADLGSGRPVRYNTWAIVPEGTFYMLGAYTESVVSLQKKLDKIKAEMAKEKPDSEPK